MPIIARRPESNFSPAPEGLHQAVCVDVIDLGMVEDPQYGPKHKVEVRWQLEDLDPKSDPMHPRRFMVQKRYNNVLSTKATLRRDLESWRGRKFSEEELKGFDLDVLVGINCQLQVVHNIKDEGGVWANVQAIVPLGKGMTKLEPQGYTRVQDRDRTKDGWGATLADAEETPF